MNPRDGLGLTEEEGGRRLKQLQPEKSLPEDHLTHHIGAVPFLGTRLEAACLPSSCTTHQLLSLLSSYCLA